MQEIKSKLLASSVICALTCSRKGNSFRPAAASQLDKAVKLEPED